jgi:membrane protein implicated in regulation of membrane protease activity
MTWADFYLFCFAFGFIFSMVSVLIGHLHFDFGGHGHADIGNLSHAGGPAQADMGDLSHIGGDGHGAHDGGHNHRGGSGVSPFNFATAAAFLAWFGGTGYLITRFYTAWVVTTLAAASVSGAAGGWIVYLFLSKVLMRSREHLDPADYDMIGVLGTVSGSIRAGGTGEILFSQAGVRRCAAARSEDGREIANGTEVVVTRYESGIAYVRRWDEMTGGSAGG